jgi:cation transport ATPase
LAHALAYVGYTFYGHAPLWFTYGAANSLLAVALAFYGASLFRIVELPVPWSRVFAPAALMLVLMVSLIDTLEPRMLAASIKATQPNSVGVWAIMASHRAMAGRAK